MEDQTNDNRRRNRFGGILTLAAMLTLVIVGCQGTTETKSVDTTAPVPGAAAPASAGSTAPGAKAPVPGNPNPSAAANAAAFEAARNKAQGK